MKPESEEIHEVILGYAEIHKKIIGKFVIVPCLYIECKERSIVCTIPLTFVSPTLTPSRNVKVHMTRNFFFLFLVVGYL